MKKTKKSFKTIMYEKVVEKNNQTTRVERMLMAVKRRNRPITLPKIKLP